MGADTIYVKDKHGQVLRFQAVLFRCMSSATKSMRLVKSMGCLNILYF